MVDWRRWESTVGNNDDLSTRVGRIPRYSCDKEMNRYRRYKMMRKGRKGERRGEERRGERGRTTTPRGWFKPYFTPSGYVNGNIRPRSPLQTTGKTLL